MLLIIAKRTADWKEFAVRFHTKGIFSYRCGYENALLMCEKKDTGGVILDCTQDPKGGEKLCRALRALYADMPIAAVVDSNSIPDLPATRVIRSHGMNQALFDEILDFSIRICGLDTKLLAAYFLTVTEDPAKTLYMGYQMPLSARQHTILRFLLYRAPRLTSADDLMELCFPECNTGIANLTAQIRAINRRALLIDPRPLIVNEYGKGYRLRDGIL